MCIRDSCIGDAFVIMSCTCIQKRDQGSVRHLPWYKGYAPLTPLAFLKRKAGQKKLHFVARWFELKPSGGFRFSRKVTKRGKFFFKRLGKRAFHFAKSLQRDCFYVLFASAKRTKKQPRGSRPSRLPGNGSKFRAWEFIDKPQACLLYTSL